MKITRDSVDALKKELERNHKELASKNVEKLEQEGRAGQPMSTSSFVLKEARKC